MKRMPEDDGQGNSARARFCKSDDACIDLSAQFLAKRPADLLRAVAQFAEEEGEEKVDVYGTGPPVQRFECEIASRLGKPKALFFPTGSIAQVAALQSHAILEHNHWSSAHPSARTLPSFLGGNHTPTVALHPTSHIVHHDCLRKGEEQSSAVQARKDINLPNFSVLPFGTVSRAASLADVEQVLREADKQGTKLLALVLELPQRCNGGAVLPFEELQQVRALTKEKGIALHMDGARLWEVQPFFDRSLSEISALFDSVYVSFYKGIGGIGGAILASTEELIEVALARRDAIGAKVFCAMPNALHCHMQFRRTIDTFPDRFKRLREMVRLVSTQVATHAAGKIRFDPPVPQSCLVHCYLQGSQADVEAAHALVVKEHGVRLWNTIRGVGHSTAGECYFEWSMGPQNAAVSDEDLTRGWKELLSSLYA